MHSTRLEVLSFTNNHKRQCGSYLFAIGTRHAVMSASVCRNYEHRSRHRGTSWLRLPNCCLLRRRWRAAVDDDARR